MIIKRFKSEYVEIEYFVEELPKIEKFYDDNPGFRSIYSGPKPLDFPKLDPKIRLLRGYIDEQIGTEEIV